MTHFAEPTPRRADSKLIVALDVKTAREALEIAAELEEVTDIFKVGLQLFTSEGIEVVKELVRRDLRVFLDLKYHDIPNTVASAALEAARHRVWMMNFHALGGYEMLARAAENVHDFCTKESIRPPLLVAVTVLTSAGSKDLSEIGLTSDAERLVLKLSQLTKKAGMDGVVASANEASEIRTVFGEDFVIVTPGIRPVTTDTNDQKRIMTPPAAIENGSSYLVVGRPIIEAASRKDAARAIKEEIDKALEEKSKSSR